MVPTACLGRQTYQEKNWIASLFGTFEIVCKPSSKIEVSRQSMYGNDAAKTAHMKTNQPQNQATIILKGGYKIVHGKLSLCLKQVEKMQWKKNVGRGAFKWILYHCRWSFSMNINFDVSLPLCCSTYADQRADVSYMYNVMLLFRAFDRMLIWSYVTWEVLLCEWNTLLVCSPDFVFVCKSLFYPGDETCYTVASRLPFRRNHSECFPLTHPC